MSEKLSPKGVLMRTVVHDAVKVFIDASERDNEDFREAAAVAVGILGDEISILLGAISNDAVRDTFIDLFCKKLSEQVKIRHQHALTLISRQTVQ